MLHAEIRGSVLAFLKQLGVWVHLETQIPQTALNQKTVRYYKP